MYTFEVKVGTMSGKAFTLESTSQFERLQDACLFAIEAAVSGRTASISGIGREYAASAMNGRLVPMPRYAQETALALA